MAATGVIIRAMICQYLSASGDEIFLGSDLIAITEIIPKKKIQERYTRELLPESGDFPLRMQ